MPQSICMILHVSYVPARKIPFQSLKSSNFSDVYNLATKVIDLPIFLTLTIPRNFHFPGCLVRWLPRSLALKGLALAPAK